MLCGCVCCVGVGGDVVWVCVLCGGGWGCCVGGGCVGVCMCVMCGSGWRCVCCVGVGVC